MKIIFITHILKPLHVLYTIYICIIHFTSVDKNKLFVMCGQETYSMPTRMFAEGYQHGYLPVFLPSLGSGSKWDQRGGNSKSVRNPELMMEWFREMNGCSGHEFLHYRVAWRSVSKHSRHLSVRFWLKHTALQGTLPASLSTLEWQLNSESRHNNQRNSWIRVRCPWQNACLCWSTKQVCAAN